MWVEPRLETIERELHLRRACSRQRELAARRNQAKAADLTRPSPQPAATTTRMETPVRRYTTRSA